MITPKRLSVKFFSELPDGLELVDFKPVFQRWIQERSLENMLIDVADYKHMYEGPGVMLIAYEGDYALDLRDGKPGIQYTRKRALGADLIETVSTTYRLALSAAVKLEQEESLAGVKFDYSLAKLEFLDRLNYPNTAETLSEVQQALAPFAQELYSADVTIDSAHSDPREAFALYIKTEAEANGNALLDKLSTVNQAAT